MKVTPKAGQFSYSLCLRLTSEQRERLVKAVPVSPGCASPSGVIRRAIDEYLERILGQSPD